MQPVIFQITKVLFTSLSLIVLIKLHTRYGNMSKTNNTTTDTSLNTAIIYNFETNLNRGKLTSN